MKKIFGNWKLVFGFAIILSITILFIYFLRLETATPSKGWSKEFLIKEVKNTEINENARVRVTAVPIIQKKKFIVLWYTRNSLNYVMISEDGTRSAIRKISIDLNDPIELKAVINNGRIELYSLESKLLKEYEFDYITERLKYIRTVGRNINAFKVLYGGVFIAKDNEISFVDANDNKTLINSCGGNVIDAIEDSTGAYKISYVKIDNDTMNLYYSEFNVQKRRISSYIISKSFEFSYGLTISGISIGEDDKRVYIIIPKKNYNEEPSYTLGEKIVCRRQPLKVETRIRMYSFDKKNVEKVVSGFLNDTNVDATDIIQTGEVPNEISIISSTLTVKGKRKDAINFRKYVLKNDNIEPREFITNTADISVNPMWFKIVDNKFMVWEDKTGSSTKIMYASSNYKIIKKSKKIDMGRTLSALLNTLTADGFALGTGVLLFACIILPGFVFILIASMLFLNWIEANFKKGMFIIIGIHEVTEIISLYYLKIKMPVAINSMPGIIQNALGAVIMILALGVISYYCVKLKYNNIEDKSFIINYLFFTIINITLFVLIFVPYFYLKWM